MEAPLPGVLLVTPGWHKNELVSVAKLLMETWASIGAEISRMKIVSVLVMGLDAREVVFVFESR